MTNIEVLTINVYYEVLNKAPKGGWEWNGIFVPLPFASDFEPCLDLYNTLVGYIAITLLNWSDCLVMPDCESDFEMNCSSVGYLGTSDLINQSF